MNNDSDMKTEYFDCDCGSSEHTLRFCYFVPFKDEPAEIHTEIFLNQYRSVWQRIRIAIKYVFGYKCRYGHWDVWTLKRNDCERLKGLLDKMIEFHKQNTE